MGSHPGRTLLASLLLALAAVPARALDEEAAEDLVRKSRCLTCHSVERKKQGPAYRDVAAKYRGDAEAPGKLFTHLTTGPVVKVDGNEERHERLKTRDEDAIRNVIAWVLSR